MNKVLIISSSLRVSCNYVEPFIKKLEVFLNKKTDVDVRSAYGLDSSIINDYQTIVFAFACAAGTIPSSTLEIFDDISHLINSSQNIYTLICNDEYETDKCDYSERVVEIFSEQMNFDYKGSLKIGSCLLMNHLPYRFILTNYIKQFASAIIDLKEVSISYTYTSKAGFMNTANRYWEKVIVLEES